MPVKLMKAGITDGRGKVYLENIPVPRPGPYQCLCKIEAAATCTGTDRKIVNGNLGPSEQYPGILGHESFGTVVQLGKKVRNIKRGERFLRPVAAYPKTKIAGYWGRMGGFSEYGLTTDVKAMLEDRPQTEVSAFCQYQQCIPENVKITSVDATMLITLKEIAGYVRKLGIGFKSKVVVLGTGPVSMAICFFAKLAGAFPVVVVGRRQRPINYCKKVGADFGADSNSPDMVEKIMTYTERTGADFIIDAAGDVKLLEESGRFLTVNGTIATYAVRSGGGPLILENIKGPGYKKIVQTGPDETAAHQFLLDLVRMGSIPLNRFYSHVMPFDDFEKGFKMLNEKKAFKIVFVMKK